MKNHFSLRKTFGVLLLGLSGACAFPGVRATFFMPNESKVSEVVKINWPSDGPAIHGQVSKLIRDAIPPEGAPAKNRKELEQLGFTCTSEQCSHTSKVQYYFKEPLPQTGPTPTEVTIAISTLVKSPINDLDVKKTVLQK